jgi:hypothetical protein
MKLPTWRPPLSYTPAYWRVEILNRPDGGSAHRVRLAIRVLDRLGEETSSCIGAHNGWSGLRSRPSSGTPQHVEYRLRPDHLGASTTDTVGVTTEPDSLIPDYRIKRAGKTIIDAANEGLRQ